MPSTAPPNRTALTNLFAELPAPESGEVFEELLLRRGVRIERIVSSPEPEPTRYDQTWDEWVVLLRGAATLDLAGESLTLTAGDCLLIPAHTPHRVLSTSVEPRCLWLAVHLDAG